MPILRPEPATYPPTLLTDLASDSSPGKADDELEDARGWWAVYTRSRQEKTLARKLYARQVPFYLPLVPRDHLYRGRKVKSYVPLFHGYLFMLGAEDKRITTLATNCVSRMLRVDDPTPFFRDLLNIHQLIESGARMTVEPRLQSGRKVRVRGGAFKGLEGVVIERRGKSRLLVVVDYIQQGVSMAIEDFMVEPI